VYNNGGFSKIMLLCYLGTVTIYNNLVLRYPIANIAKLIKKELRKQDQTRTQKNSKNNINLFLL